MQKSLINLNSSKDICKTTFANNSSTYTYPTSSFPPTANIVLQNLYTDDSNNQVFISSDSIASPLSNKLKVDSIYLKNINGSSGNYIGELHVTFKNGIRQIQPSIVYVNIETATVGTDTVIKGCPGVVELVESPSGDSSTTIITYDSTLSDYCASISGSFDTTTNKCDTSKYICQVTGQTYDATNKTCGAAPPPPVAASQTFTNPKKNGLGVATFGGNGWTTWHQWCRENGFQLASSWSKGLPANPCCGNVSGKYAFTGWRCNWRCNFAVASAITCSN